MIAEVKNPKNSTMHEDSGDTDSTAATAIIQSATTIKDERLSNVASIATATATVTHSQARHVVLKAESESSCGASKSTQTNYKRKLMFALGHAGNGDGGVGGVGGGGDDGGGGDTLSTKDTMEQAHKKLKLCTEKEQMFELFQPWALKTYGDQAKTKTITLRKKARILKALEGKEHSRPDSSKFRFWVKSKAFTTQRPECFKDIPDYPESSNTEYPNNVELYVASTTKDFGQRTYRKVAVVEEFFNIIYNIHVEMGGRSGRHAGQKRTYRIITETYAFLPREAVTRFLSACPECKKNLRPLSPGRSTADDDAPNESSTEIDISTYSLQQSPEAPKTPIEKTEPIAPTSTPIIPPTEPRKRSLQLSATVTSMEKPGTPTESQAFTFPPMTQKIPPFQTQYAYPESSRSALLRESAGSPFGSQMKFGMLNRESLLRYYEFMRRLYGESFLDIISQSQEDPHKSEFGVKPPTQEAILESVDLTGDDQPTTSTRPMSRRSETVQESLPQIRAINLSKSLSSPMLLLAQNGQRRQYQQQQQPRKEQPIEQSQRDPPQEQPTPEQSTQQSSRQESDVEPEDAPPAQLDLRKVKPITSTYLQLTRSMGLSDADALKFDDLEPPMPTPPVPDTASDANNDDPYAGLMKDADKLKLMLLAWNYQNSTAVRNGTEGPDLGVVGGLWAQYQNALAQNVTKMETSISPVPRTEESSPMENQDETNSSGQKDEDEGSEDDSDDKLDQQAHDPERLKAFNMFVRLFVDENLDRIIPISKQPKEKIQAIIDSCARQFPEFSERSRKRIRTYLKSCRRNKKAREGWDNTTRPTPAHLTSVQAEQILAIACENESMNAKRMRVGLDPITQAVPLTTTTSSTSTAASSDAAVASTPFTSGFRSTPNPSTSESDALVPTTTSTQGASSSARSSPLALSSTSVGQPMGGGGNTLANGNTTVTSVGALPTSSPLYRPTDFTSPTSTSPYAARTPTYPNYFSGNATPTDLSMKPSSAQQPSQSITSTAIATSSSLSPNARPPPPLVTHKLSANEITAARQVITAYRESAAFLLRTADQVEQLLVQQQ